MGENTTTRLDAWLVRIKGGDVERRAAFEELLRHFEARLEALASRMLKEFPEVAAREGTGDVLQAALWRLVQALRALVAREEFQAGAKAFQGADFFRLAALQIRRELLDLAEWHRRRPAGELPDPDGLAGPAPATWDPARLVWWTGFHEKAAKLPEKVREVFFLLYYDGRKQKDAARLLGVDVRTVKSRWLDARLRLRDAFGGRLP